MTRTSACRPRSQGGRYFAVVSARCASVPLARSPTFGRGVESRQPVVRRLSDVKFGAEMMLDGALVYRERVAAAHIGAACQ